jgi:hypothetical protein
MMEAARTNETSVDNYFTWQYIPEDDSELHTRHREDFNSQNPKLTSIEFDIRNNVSKFPKLM